MRNWSPSRSTPMDFSPLRTYGTPNRSPRTDPTTSRHGDLPAHGFLEDGQLDVRADAADVLVDVAGTGHRCYVTSLPSLPCEPVRDLLRSLPQSVDVVVPSQPNGASAAMFVGSCATGSATRFGGALATRSSRFSRAIGCCSICSWPQPTRYFATCQVPFGSTVRSHASRAHE